MKPHKKIEQYTTDMSLSLTQRAAHFLDWAAKNMPGDPIPYNVIVKKIMNLPQLPRLDNDTVDRFRRSAGAGLKKAMIDKYGREIVNLPGIGIRATVDDADRLANVAPIKARRLNAARKSFMITATGIDLRNVPNTPEYAGLKAWMGREVKHVLEKIGSEDFMRKLLPPGTPTPENEK